MFSRGGTSRPQRGEEHHLVLLGGELKGKKGKGRGCILLPILFVYRFKGKGEQSRDGGRELERRKSREHMTFLLGDSYFCKYVGALDILNMCLKRGVYNSQKTEEV